MNLVENRLDELMHRSQVLGQGYKQKNHKSDYQNCIDELVHFIYKS